MINLKSLGKKSLIISTLVIMSIGYISVSNYNKLHNQQIVVNIDNAYDSAVNKPEWITKNADLIVIGEITSKNIVKDKSDVINEGDVVYTDNNIKISKILKNKENKNIKEGTTIDIRTLGGTVGNLTVHADTESLIPNNGMVLLYLSISKTSTKEAYSVVGGIHGAFNLPQTTNSGKSVDSVNVSKGLGEDINVNRSILKDQFKFSDLQKVIDEEK